VCVLSFLPHLIPSCCLGLGSVGRRVGEGHGAWPRRLMWRAAHRWRLIDAPFTLALAALLLPVAAPQAVEEGFPQQHSAARIFVAVCGSHTHTRAHAPRAQPWANPNLITVHVGAVGFAPIHQLHALNVTISMF